MDNFFWAILDSVLHRVPLLSIADIFYLSYYPIFAAGVILLAEDNRINQRMALLMLKKLGYGADTVADGKEVMRALDRQPYDIILIEIQMPDMDGLYATQEYVSFGLLTAPKS